MIERGIGKVSWILAVYVLVAEGVYELEVLCYAGKQILWLDISLTVLFSWLSTRLVLQLLIFNEAQCLVTKRNKVRCVLALASIWYRAMSESTDRAASAVTRC